MSKIIFLAVLTAALLSAIECDVAADEKACDAGDFESCDNLGLAYIDINIEGCDLDKNC